MTYFAFGFVYPFPVAQGETSVAWSLLSGQLLYGRVESGFKGMHVLLVRFMLIYVINKIGYYFVLTSLLIFCYKESS